MIAGCWLAGLLAGWLSGLLVCWLAAWIYFFFHHQIYFFSPSGGTFPGNYLVGGDARSLGYVSMPLMQPNFDFKSHPGRTFQEFFSWMGGLWRSCPETAKKQKTIFENPKIHFHISIFWWYSYLQYCYDLEHISQWIPGLDLSVDVEISLQNPKNT